MKLIETTVSETTVHLQLANDADLERATEWFEFKVPLEGLVIDAEENPLGDPAKRRLATIQRAALHRVLVAVTVEIARLAILSDRELLSFFGRPRPLTASDSDEGLKLEPLSNNLPAGPGNASTVMPSGACDR